MWVIWTSIKAICNPIGIPIKTFIRLPIAVIVYTIADFSGWCPRLAGVYLRSIYT
jgi:hypothetical protein